jgi:hypothetical protein
VKMSHFEMAIRRQVKSSQSYFLHSGTMNRYVRVVWITPIKHQHWISRPLEKCQTLKTFQRFGVFRG